ncbi:hypothetical protein ACILG0_13155 [Pseudomonadota bacterium AL_CKDN230030165-1A_HGKHYDSX7]
MPLPQGYLQMIATHLNAPYGAILTAADVRAALRAGTLQGLAVSALGKELIAGMYVELQPEVIGCASYEAGVNLEEAQALYEHVRAQWAMPRVAAWEEALTGVL